MQEQVIRTEAERAPYARPVVEDLGSLRELTAAGGPQYGIDSSYNGSPGSFGVS
jgi:hypothetical protein